MQRSYNLDDIQSVASEIAAICKHRKKIAFLGEMGAGKTTLIQALCSFLGSTENVTSPTFSIVNEYAIAKQTEDTAQCIYHIDLYRLKNMDEALDMGIEEYLDDDNYCLIEWPQLIYDLLPPETVWIQLSLLADNTRKITITNAGERSTETDQDRF